MKSLANPFYSNNRNGERPQDPSREEGRQEGSQGQHLSQSPSATDGGPDGKEGIQAPWRQEEVILFFVRKN